MSGYARTASSAHLPVVPPRTAAGVVTGESMDFWRIAQILAKRKWLILFSIVVTVILTYVSTRLSGAQWVATVRFVSPTTPSVAANPQSSNNPDWVTEGQDFAALKAMYATVITSREVIEPAIQEMKMARPPDAIASQIEFNAVGPRLFELNVTDSSPSGAEMIANAVADSFVDRVHSMYTARTQEAVKLLEDQLKEADEKLVTSRRRYESYARRNQTLGTPQEDVRTALSQVEAARRRRDQLTEEIATVQGQLRNKEGELAERPPTASPAQLSLAAARVTRLEEEVLRSERELDTLRTRYGENWPAYRDAVVALDELRGRLIGAREEHRHIAVEGVKAANYAALTKSISDLRQRLTGLQAQRSALEATIASAEGQVHRAKEIDNPYSSLVAEVTARTETRANLSNRLNNARAALDAANRQNPLVVMEYADAFNPPVNMTAGRTRKLLVLAALCALVSTSALIIAFHSADRRVKSVQEAEMALPARVLAAIPQPLGQVTYSSLARATELHPQSLHSESYRFLGLQLLTTYEPRIRSLMVLAAKAEQGSTTTITNVGITLAQAGQRVVIVDANMRTSELHQVFDLPNDIGFSDLLQSPTNETLQRALQPTSVRNLTVITSGPNPENPWELFRSSNLREVSRRLHEIADFVLYDTPSAVMFTDALNLAPVVDAAFLCVRALEQPTGAEQRLIELIEQANVRVLGSVLSDVPTSVVEGYDNYQHYYAPALNGEPTDPNRGSAKPAAPSRPPTIIQVPEPRNGRNGHS